MQQLLLANQIILVEGPADELIIQRAYRDNFGKLPIEDGVDVMSVGGVAFKRYCELARLINKRIVIVPVGTVLPFIKEGKTITSPQTKSKFYVACTRARHSVVFAIENFTENEHFKSCIVKIGSKELPALRYVK